MTQMPFQMYLIPIFVQLQNILLVRASECPGVKNYKWQLNPVWHRLYPYGNSGRQRIKLLNCELLAIAGLLVSMWVCVVRRYREQVVDVDDHESEAVESGLLFSLIRQLAGSGVLLTSTGVLDWRHVWPIDVEERRSETDGQVARRHLTSIHSWLNELTENSYHKGDHGRDYSLYHNETSFKLKHQTG